MNMKNDIRFFAGLVAFATVLTMMAIIFIALGNIYGFGIGVFAIGNWIIVKSEYDDVLHKIEFEKWMESLER
jgi:hypothetical protein